VTMFMRGLDRLIGCVVAAAKWLALPLITLLFLQWPLRELFRGYSREANWGRWCLRCSSPSASLRLRVRERTSQSISWPSGTPHERGDASIRWVPPSDFCHGHCCS
jgi:hypothetical protein